jgi:hypothetical protein
MEIYEQITSYLYRTSKILASWLKKALPELSQNWWENNVVAKLNNAERNRVRNKNITSLSGLDLAAFLRVFDHNWYELSQEYKLNYEDNHLLKEMKKIRNNWAHETPEGYKQNDIYRDLDTIQRFIALIDENEILINEIKKTMVVYFHTIHQYIQSRNHLLLKNQ